ncbi:MAG: O-antigen ligase family protein [Pseudomonadota bacterium]|nr:O-antigen ligase family protein [Pseudomonadota bacterium]
MSSSAPTYGLSARLRDWQETVTFDPRLVRVAAIAGLMAFGAVCGVAIALGGVAAAIIGLSLVACLFCVRDFRVGIVMLVLIMPISQSYVFPHAMFGITGLNPLNLLLITSLGLMVMRVAGDGTLWRLMPKPLVWLYLAPLAVGAALGAPHVNEIPAIFHDTEMIFFTNAFGYVRDMLLKPLTFVLYALLVSVAVARSARPERFITPMLVSVALMAGVVLVYTAMSGVSISALAGTYARHFFSALGMHANDLGRLYAIAYAMLLFTWDRTPTLGMKTLCIAAMGVVVLALLLTFSRGAFLGFILVNVIYLLSRRSRKTLLLALVLIPVGLYFTPGAVWYRVTMGWGESSNTVSAGRVDEIWGPLLPELLSSPIWGHGLGAVMWAKPMILGMMPFVGHPHNAYIQAIYDVGLVGAALLCAFWFITWKDFRRLAKDDRLVPALQGFFEGAAAGLVSFLVAGMAGSSLAPKPEQAFLWLAVGIAYGVRKKLAPRVPAQTAGAT